MAAGKFGTAINCMDGRAQLPVITWMKEKFGLDYIDMITEPGPDRIVSEGDPRQVASVRYRTEISVEKHHSKIVVVMGHDDCAGNPGPKEQHIGQIMAAMRVIDGWNLPISIYGIWMGADWKPEIIDKIEKD